MRIQRRRVVLALAQLVWVQLAAAQAAWVQQLVAAQLGSALLEPLASREARTSVPQGCWLVWRAAHPWARRRRRVGPLA